MRLLAFDIETTGFDPAKDRILELGWVLYDAKEKQILVSESRFVYEPDYPTSNASALEAHGIQLKTLEEFGRPAKEVFTSFLTCLRLWNVSILVGHNSRAFDFPFLVSECKRVGLDPEPLTALKQIDTRVDLQFDKEPDSRKLKYMAADIGYINPFPHRAMFDALTCLKILNTHDLEKTLLYAAMPEYLVEAVVAFDNKEAAKLRGYRWQPADKKWVKTLKLDALEREKLEAPFKIKIHGNT